MTNKKKSSKKSSEKSLQSSLMFALVVALALFSLIGIAQTNPKNSVEKETKVLAQVSEKIIEDSRPKLKEGVVWSESLSARGVYAFDIDSGETLFTKEEDNPILPASTTKLATALVALQDYKLEDIVTIKNVKNISGNKMGLVLGEKITVRDLLYGLLIYSANDAAYALADYNSSGRGTFILNMNILSQNLGLSKTHFTNPAGFDEYLHFSTAKDMANLAYQAVQNPIITQIVSTSYAEVFSIDQKYVHKLVNTNHLLGKVQGVIGVKTGTTITSGESLITMVDRDGKKIILSVLGSNDRFGESEKIIEWIYSNYSWGIVAAGVTSWE